MVSPSSMVAWNSNVPSAHSNIRTNAFIPTTGPTRADRSKPPWNAIVPSSDDVLRCSVPAVAFVANADTSDEFQELLDRSRRLLEVKLRFEAARNQTHGLMADRSRWH